MEYYEFDCGFGPVPWKYFQEHQVCPDDSHEVSRRSFPLAADIKPLFLVL
jgi:hypothetical protein